jgi:hypothetical protein
MFQSIRLRTIPLYNSICYKVVYNDIYCKCKCLSCSVKVGMKLLNIETPVTRNFILQILFNVQDFYFHKVGYTCYDEGIFRP